MKYRETYRIVTQVSRYVSHRDFRYRATPSISIDIGVVIFSRHRYRYRHLQICNNSASSVCVRTEVGAAGRLAEEKEQLVLELLQEGEKLSKQQLANSNIIKKLRAKEKETDSVAKTNRYTSGPLSGYMRRH